MSFGWPAKPVLDEDRFDLVMEPWQDAVEATVEMIGSGADPLGRWRRGGFAGKQVCFLGDSTTSNASALFTDLRGIHAAPGGALSTITTPASDILNYGENGASLAAFLSNSVTHGITNAIAAQADLYVFCYGINDVRLGATSQATLEARVISAVEQLRAGVPDADILLRVPNSLLTVDTGSNDFVSPETAEAAQLYTDILRGAYLTMQNRWPNVLVWDAMAEIFGTISQASSIYMTDQLHPNNLGNQVLAAALAKQIGIVPAKVVPTVLPSSEVLPAVAAGPSSVAIALSSPWTLDPNLLRDTRYYKKVAESRYVNQSASYLDIAWPGAFASEIKTYDIVVMGDVTPWVIPASSTISDSGGGQTRIVPTGGMPTNSMTAGMVRIYRRTVADATILAYASAKTLYRYQRFGLVSEGGTNYMRLFADYDDNLPNAKNWNVTASDVLVIEGVGAVSLSGATFSASGNNLQISKTGAFASYVGKRFGLFGTHIREAGAGMDVTVDPASISAGAVGETSVTVSGAVTTDLVVVRPPVGLDTGIVFSAFVSAADTVKLRLFNGTGSPIDIASATWRFLLLR